MNPGLRTLFLNEKPVEALTIIRTEKRVRAQRLSEEIDIDYGYTVEILEEMKDYGLLETERTEEKEYVLTSHGKSIAESILQVSDLAYMRSQDQGKISGFGEPASVGEGL